MDRARDRIDVDGIDQQEDPLLQLPLLENGTNTKGSDDESFAEVNNRVPLDGSTVAGSVTSQSAASTDASSTSMILIVFLHMIFLRQWSCRKRRKDVLVSYRVIVQKRRFHKLWLAILSHPPTQNQLRVSQPTSTSTSGSNDRNIVGYGAEVGSLNGHLNDSQWLQDDLLFPFRIQLRQFSSWSYQSGFGLMLYNSHILWSCRSLEAWYSFERVSVGNAGPQPESTPAFVTASRTFQPHQYARVLFALTAVALLLELRFFFNLLRISKKFEGVSSVLQTNSNSSDQGDTAGTSAVTTRGHNRIHQKILYRPIGTMTTLSSALVLVFQHHFQYIPLQVLPFVDNKWLLLGFSMPAALTSLICWGILGCLSYPSHPITPILCGLASGMLWVAGLTSFLQEDYWGNSFIAAFLVMCCLSIRASETVIPTHDVTATDFDCQQQSTWIPCIDFVSWNKRGESILQYSGDDFRSLTTAAEDGAIMDEDDQSQSSGDDLSVVYSSRLTTADLDEGNNSEAGTTNLELVSLLERSGRSQTVRARRGATMG